MKNTIIAVFKLLLFASVIGGIVAFFIMHNPADSKTKLTKQEKEQKRKDAIKSLLEYDSEKIALLSQSLNVQLDTVNAILYKYSEMTDTMYTFKKIPNNVYLEVLDSISHTFLMPKDKVANIVLNYKYKTLEDN